MFAFMSVAAAACLVVDGVDVDGKDLSVRMDEGRITAVGSVDRAGCTVPELPDGVLLTPGLVEVNSSAGVAEVGAEDHTVDNRGDGDGIRPTLRVADAHNPVSVHVPVKRLGGITSAVVVPRGGLIAGQAAWVRMAGATQAASVVDRELAMVGSVDGASRALQLDRLAELIEDVRTYAANRSKAENGAYRSFPDGVSHRDLEALLPVVKGEQRLIVGANRASDIEALLRFAEQARVRLVIDGAAEGWRVREELARTDTPVIVDPFVYGAGGFDQIHGRADNPALLADAGVLVMFSSWTHNAPLSAQLAGNAVRGGMKPSDALAAITVNPAKAFGLDGFGTLTVGAAADLVAWSGDPLEIGSRPLLVVVDGEVRDLDSRQRALFRRFRTLPGSPTEPLDLPVE